MLECLRAGCLQRPACITWRELYVAYALDKMFTCSNGEDHVHITANILSCMRVDGDIYPHLLFWLLQGCERS
jgi:hypothetical protein